MSIHSKAIPAQHLLHIKGRGDNTIASSSENLIGIFILQGNGLRLIIYTRLLKIFQGSIWISLPQFFYFVDLLSADLARPQLFLLRGDLQHSTRHKYRTENKNQKDQRERTRKRIQTLTSHCKKHLSSMSGHHWLRSQFISFNALTLRQGSLQRRTTTLSALAEMKPRRKTFRHPQL